MTASAKIFFTASMSSASTFPPLPNDALIFHCWQGIFSQLAAKELGGRNQECYTRNQRLPVLTWIWPGNVRQLENTCRWLTVMASGREILISDLPPELGQQQNSLSTTPDWQQQLREWADYQLASGGVRLLDSAIPDFERIMIEAALRHTRGRRRDAANLLGWGRNTLTRKIKELELETESEGESEEDIGDHSP